MKLVLGLCAAAFALSGASLNSVTLTNVGNPRLNDGSHYVGPYTLRVNGHNMPVLCIDFTDQSRVGASWSAQLSQLSGGLQRTYHSSYAVQYEEEAYLCELILRPAADRIDIQHAAWAIMDPYFIPTKAALKWIVLAQENYADIDCSRFEIVSDVDRDSATRNQEFITAVAPEPPLIELLGGLIAVGFSAVGATKRLKGPRR